MHNQCIGDLSWKKILTSSKKHKSNNFSSYAKLLPDWLEKRKMPKELP